MEDERCLFSVLPDELVIKILSYLSPYGDTYQAKQVCKRWRKLLKIVTSHDVNNFYNSVKTGSVRWGKILSKTEEGFLNTLPILRFNNPRRTNEPSVSAPDSLPTPRFSLCACCYEDAMYVFGGCSPTNEALNDMYKLDLRTRSWTRIEAQGILPSPRECCTMVSHDHKLVIFGGWCQPRRFDLAPRFFNHVHVFDLTTKTWTTIEDREGEERPFERAGHTASVTKDKMIVVGGAQRNMRFDDVWVMNLKTYSWYCPQIRENKPAKRFGHSQFILNEDFVLIVGGCGGPDMLFNDAWLLNTYGWVWTELRVRNKLFEPPLLWCHPAVKLNDQVVIFSEERTCLDCRANRKDAINNATQDKELCSRCRDASGAPSPAPGACARMQMYVMDCSKCVLGHHVTWRDIPLLNKSPSSRSLYSAVVGKGEFVIFGGVQNTQRPDAIQTANNHLLFISPRDRRL